jgi:phosphohistidine phosphatase
MELFIVRHAKAADRDPARWPDDALRPLTRDGARDFERVAKQLGRWRPRVDRVYASGWTRAWETAQILRVHAGWPKPERNALLETGDLADAPALGAFLAEQPMDARIAVVGHEPVLGAVLASVGWLGGGPQIALRKGAVACLAGTPGAMELRGLLVPAMFRPR